MPSFDLSQGSQSLTRYDVVGQHSGVVPFFIEHVGLSKREVSDVSLGGAVDVAHMGPPLDTGGVMRAHAVGRIPLANDEIKQVEVWIEEVADEYSDEKVHGRRQFCYLSPWEDVPDDNTNVRRYRRYSCAGFVIDAYSQVHVKLFDFENGVWPDVDKGMLQLAYPGASPVRASHRRSKIQGSGPQRIVPAGYVLHALDRPSELIRREPYQAQSGDELFPSAQ